MKLIDGKLISEQIKAEIKAEVAALIDSGARAPHLAAILVGEDPASQTYVASKEKNCQSVGITSTIYRLDKSISEKELEDTVRFLNNDPEVDGFIVQLPLPEQFDEQRIIEMINPDKDVDGFHPINVGKLVLGQDGFVSATPAGIMEMLKRSGIETVGKHCVVIGRSNIVGTPMSILMSRTTNPGNSTVTLCHSKTQNLKEITASADILIVAIGKPRFVTADMVKEGAVVIDVGMHRLEDTTKKNGFRLVGDVDFEEVSKKASWITPVPGGVGLTTIAALLQNTLKARKKVAK
ncbi:MAG: bifunctional methylenetetrahydrofolate dehydrogenase/methenyltetrahydrofolate cyclohydrolase FolD [Bacteroidetes bacterium HGW-Bacteroidetes-6]|jgi:methylenetetrahydrofolate dehydrogenase (NADP+)/methenyltetrahydrofolate cyclohydrolase|nr:MAG: bifunctional methylenetetrahydrofolate dehydrogenase/methenyltetrahydrofolate cyclohydrolase FolD [Bacteroidetes bacterium HGW-Bacteroidetes-6]